jgi:hypothetical protein
MTNIARQAWNVGLDCSAECAADRFGKSQQFLSWSFDENPGRKHSFLLAQS